MGVGVTLSLQQAATGHAASAIGLRTPHVTAGSFDAYWQAFGGQIRSIVGLMDDGLCDRHTTVLIELPARERDVLLLLSIGFRPDQIATRLNIALTTVNNTVVRAKRRLNARTRDHAVAIAVRLGLIDIR